MSQTGNNQVVISGVGVISALGNGIEPLWEAMLEGRTGLKRIERFNPSGFASQVAGELSEDERSKFHYSVQMRKYGFL